MISPPIFERKDDGAEIQRGLSYRADNCPHQSCAPKKAVIMLACTLDSRASCFYSRSGRGDTRVAHVGCVSAAAGQQQRRYLPPHRRPSETALGAISCAERDGIGALGGGYVAGHEWLEVGRAVQALDPGLAPGFAKVQPSEERKSLFHLNPCFLSVAPLIRGGGHGDWFLEREAPRGAASPQGRDQRLAAVRALQTVGCVVEIAQAVSTIETARNEDPGFKRRFQL